MTATYGSIFLLVFGVWALIAVDNLIKKVFALNVISGATVLFLIAQGYRTGGTAPILTATARTIVDPVPQALMLTAIVINLCMTALALVFIIRLFENEKTMNESDIGRRLEED